MLYKLYSNGLEKNQRGNNFTYSGPLTIAQDYADYLKAEGIDYSITSTGSKSYITVSEEDVERADEIYN